MQTGYLQVEGSELYYEVHGSGHALTLIHAGVADLTMWDEQFAEFAEHFRVLRYDTRGFGNTKTEGVSFSHRQDLLSLLDHLVIEKTYVLGLSRGGQIAIDFTLEFPERVDALIAVAAGVSGYDPGEPHPDELAIYQQMEKHYRAGDYAALDELELRLWVDGIHRTPDQVKPSVRERVRRMNSNVPREFGKPIELDPPAANRLSEIRVPTLVIVGDYDTSDTVGTADYLAQQIAGSKKVVFPKVAHMVNMEEPAEFNRTVLEFLREVHGSTTRTS
jgi:3-oxoadipate enol-lactonase